MSISICTPLILQDNLGLVESFVTGHPQLQEQLVKLLDSWCHPLFSAEDFSMYGRLHKRVSVYQDVENLLSLLIGVPLCPNTLNKRRRQTLSFLMFKRFEEVSSSAGLQCNKHGYYLCMYSTSQNDRLPVRHRANTQTDKHTHTHI
uniref:Uncharacterized protein n=1 Tax=Myripristis murdjan TaxID=586833 RepID=A0A667ZVB4_9TELE